MSKATSSEKRDSASPQKVVEPFEAAYNEYQRRVREVTLTFRQQLYDAYIEYLKSIETVRWSQAADTVQQGLENILNTYNEAIKTAQANANQNAEDAYRQYVSESQKAWVDVDVDRLDTVSLAAIGQCMVAVVNRAIGALPIY